uniref:Uncharacterized protein n=1 Tax=Helianthus annuus TaxID=4232 RepID=A0A1Y3BTR4_HELAN
MNENRAKWAEVNCHLFEQSNSCGGDKEYVSGHPFSVEVLVNFCFCRLHIFDEDRPLQQLCSTVWLFETPVRF